MKTGTVFRQGPTRHVSDREMAMRKYVFFALILLCALILFISVRQQRLREELFFAGSCTSRCCRFPSINVPI